MCGNSLKTYCVTTMIEFYAVWYSIAIVCIYSFSFVRYVDMQR